MWYGNLTEIQFAYLLIIPTLLVLALVMFYPIINVFWQSLHFERLNQPARGTPFIGLEHYRRMLWGNAMQWNLMHQWPWRALGLSGLLWLAYAAKRRWLNRREAVLWALLLLLIFGLWLGFHPQEGGRWGDLRFWNSLRVTLLFTFISVTGAFLIGLPLALLANVTSRWRWLMRVSLLLPWAMPRVFTGLTFAWLFQNQYGLFNDILQRVGIEGPLWLSREMPALVAVNITIIWQTSSFVGLILLAGLQSIDESLYEAAMVDGASMWQRFWSITMPLLRPAIAIALISRTITALQTFDIPFAMTRGGPGRSLETLGIYIYNTTLGLNIGYAAALSVLLFVVSFAVTILYMRWVYTDSR